MEMVGALKIVDEVIEYKHINADTIGKLGVDFDVYCLGEDNVGERWDAIIQWCHDHGKEVARLKRTPGVSSTELRANVKERLV